MKLLYCQSCDDVFNLTFETKTCACGKTKGRYLDSLNAQYEGETAIPLGFANKSFIEAIRNQPDIDWGRNFTAFVIEKECKTFTKLK